MKKMRQQLITALSAAVACFLLIPTAAADIVNPDDVIIQGSACIGFDCVNGESFGFDTIRLKENNLRIKAMDTSVGTFPTNDWEITFNDSASGGLSKFAVTDIDGGKVPFTIEAGTPSNSLYVDSTHRVGFGTSTPVLDLHVKTGNTPGLRLEQDGTSGFTPQIWDLAGNEANFFLRDVTSGSRLPFRVRPGAPTSSIDISASGNVGLGTGSPNAALHVRRTVATGTTGTTMLNLENNGDAILQVLDTTGGNTNTWQIRGRSTDLLFTHPNVANTMFLNSGGNLTVAGNYFAQGGTQLNVPDYVFEPGYKLMPLKDVAQFVENEKHLPGIKKASEIKKEGLNMTEMQLKLLEKVEELTLHAIAQQKTIDELVARVEQLQK